MLIRLGKRYGGRKAISVPRLSFAVLAASTNCLAGEQFRVDLPTEFDIIEKDLVKWNTGSGFFGYTLAGLKRRTPAETGLRYRVNPSDTDGAIKALDIGRKIRELRKRKALTLQDLSDATGLSKPLLSQIENQIVIPPISTLLKISRALEKEIAFFFQEPDNEKKVTIVRPFERQRLDTRVPGRRGAGYLYESLAYKKTNKNMEPFLVEFERKDQREMSFYSHGGEEFVFVLEGSLEFQTRDEVHRLKAGDSLYFESDLPHAYRAVGKRNAKAIAVIFSTS